VFTNTRSLTHNRTLDNNQLTALNAGLFDENTALEVLYVDQEGGAGGCKAGNTVDKWWAGEELEWTGGKNARKTLGDGKVVEETALTVETSAIAAKTSSGPRLGQCLQCLSCAHHRLLFMQIGLFTIISWLRWTWACLTRTLRLTLCVLIKEGLVGWWAWRGMHGRRCAMARWLVEEGAVTRRSDDGCHHSPDPSRLDDNALTALNVSLFNNNVALTELYVVKRWRV
jgi:hypothetical protein